jgi:hypothetical protein
LNKLLEDLIEKKERTNINTEYKTVQRAIAILNVLNKKTDLRPYMNKG